MKTKNAIIALAIALFAVAAFADHNRVDQYGRKQGHWTEFPGGKLLASETFYVNGLAHGKSIMRWADGGVWEGQFVAGRMHGKWIMRWANGNVHEGQMVNDQRHGKWVLRFANGDVWEGPYVDGKMHGHWVWRFAGGDVHEGPYVNGEMHGKWALRAVNGFVTETPYVAGKKHGKSISRLSDGTQLESHYANGEQVCFDEGGKQVPFMDCLPADVREAAESAKKCPKNEFWAACMQRWGWREIMSREEVTEAQKESAK